jgi:hypothetical protein
MVYYNCKTEKINPKSIKYILGIIECDNPIKINNLEL